MFLERKRKENARSAPGGEEENKNKKLGALEKKNRERRGERGRDNRHSARAGEEEETENTLRTLGEERAHSAHWR